MNSQTFVGCVAGGLLAPALALGDVLDFEKADVGSVPTGWTVAMTSDGGQPRWEVVRDAKSPVGQKVLGQVSGDRTSGRFPLAIYEGVETVDGSVSVRFKRFQVRSTRRPGSSGGIEIRATTTS